MKRIPSYRLSEIGDKLCDALGWFAVGICMLLAIAGVTYLVYLNREIKALNVEIAESNRNLAAIREQLSKHKGHTSRYFKMGPVYFRTPEATREMFGDKQPQQHGLSVLPE